MESRGSASRLSIITLIIVVGTLAAIAGVLYHNTLLERQLNEVGAGVSDLTATVGRLMARFEIAREEILQKDETIAGLQQEISAKEQIEKEKETYEKNKITSLISDLQPKTDPVVAGAIAEAIYKYSKKYGIPPELIVNVAMRESSFRPILESSKKAKGLMQVMPTAHPEKIEKLNVNNNNIFHIDNNIHLGTMILAEYYESKNSIYGALESYVGAELKTYINDILVGFADMKIKQFRGLPTEEVEDNEPETPGTSNDDESGNNGSDPKVSPDGESSQSVNKKQ
jgi:hypothetical protein